MDQLFSAVRLYSSLVCFCITLHIATFPARAQYGQLDTRFDPPAILNGWDPATVRSGIESGTGVVIVGDFTTVGGVAKGGIARLDFTGALDESFAPTGAANGPVHAIIRIGSDKFLIAGDFTSYGGVPRPRIARINSQGVLDTTFAPTAGPDGPIYSLLAIDNGYVVGGDFENVGESPRTNLAHFTVAGALSPSAFSTGSNGPVYALAYDSASRQVLVGGDFTKVGESPRSRIAAFSVFTGAVTTIWSYSGADGPVYSMVATPFGLTGRPSVLIGGDFRTIFGRARGNIVAAESPAYNHLGALDETFRIYANSPVRATNIFLGRLSIGGDFTVVDGSTRNRYARLKSVNSGFPLRQSFELDLSFEAGEGANGSVHGFSTTSDGITYVFGAYTSIQGSPRAGVARLLSPIGLSVPAAPTSFSATALSEKDAYLEWTPPPQHTKLELERKWAGASTWQTIPIPTPISTTTKDYMDSGLAPGIQYTYRLRAYNLNGPGAYTPELSVTTKAASWTGPGQRIAMPAIAEMADGTVSKIITLPNGNVMISGDFRNVHGAPRKYIARLLPDYTLDPSFDPGDSANSSITEMAADNGGGIYISGGFNQVAGEPRSYIAKLRADGSLDQSFDPGTSINSSIWSMAVQPHRGVLILGNFSLVDGVDRKGFARLHFDGKLDRSFELDAGFGLKISSFAIAPDGGFFVAGQFSTVNGLPRKYLARCLPDDTIDPTFLPAVNSVPSGLAPARDGSLHLVINDGTGAYKLNRLTPTGGTDPSFVPAPTTEVPRAIQLQPDGKLLLVTPLQAFGSQVRYGLVRLLSNGELDGTFDAGSARSDTTISTIAYGRDGNILVGGYLPDWAGSPASHFIVLKGSGVLPPDAPSEVHALSISGQEITVFWQGGDVETEYVLERSDDGIANWKQIALIPWTFTSWTDLSLESGKSYAYRVTARNSAGSSTSSTTSAKTFTSFQQWKVNHGIPIGTSGDDLDDDEDGIPAILEYALGLDPAVQTTEGMPVHQLLNGAIALSYRKFRDDVTYLVEGSADLTNWSADGVNQGSGAFPIAWSLMGPAPQKYLRLRITAE